MRLHTVAGVLALCVCLTPVQLLAQSFTATLQGTVTDSSGSAVPNAHVSLVNEATNVKQQEKLTDSRGAYLFTLLPPGSYRNDRADAGISGFGSIRDGFTGATAGRR